MRKQLFATMLLSALTLPVYAKGFYVFADFERNKAEADIGDFSISKTENGYGLGLGYVISNTFAVEVAYRDLMDISESGGGEDYEYSSSLDLTAFQASVVATYPLSETISLFGRLGIGKIDIDSSYYENDWGDVYRESESESKTKAVFGIGARYALSEKVGVRAEYSRFAKIDDTTLSSLSLAVDYHF
jgi:OOP family OmpA-OmpF porin